MKRITPLKRAPAFPTRQAISPASAAQRALVRGASCIVCERCGCDPAHLIPRRMTSVGQDDPRAVVPLCRGCHRDYDEGRLSLLEYLEPKYRREVAFAVERVGLISALRRLTNQRDAAVAA